MDQPGTNPTGTNPTATGRTETDRPQDLDVLPISLLDFLSFRPEHGATALRATGLRSAQLADRLGYRRIWIPEHHQRGVPSTNPVMLLPALGVLTNRIRLGTAVSLIRIRDPYLLAEDLATAAHFCRDRLDVGLGRGDVRGDVSSDGTPALRRWPEDELDRATTTVMSLLADGNAWIDPVDGSLERWLNGAGTRSGELAGRLGYHYCHALFFNPDLAAARATLAAHADGCPTGRRAVALAMVANSETDRAMAEAADLRGITVNAAGSPQHCADVVLALLADELIDEVIITEQSSRAEDHLAAIRQLADLVRSGLSDRSTLAARTDARRTASSVAADTEPAVA